MSRQVLTAMLTEMQVWLNESEKQQLYQELLAYFGLIGASNQCEALDTAWKDPYNKQEIQEFIRAWLRRKQRKKTEAIPGVV